MRFPLSAANRLRTFVQTKFHSCGEESSIEEPTRRQLHCVKKKKVSGRHYLIRFAMLCLMLGASSSAQVITNSTDDLRAGRSFSVTPVYSEADDRRILA